MCYIIWGTNYPLPCLTRTSPLPHTNWKYTLKHTQYSHTAKWVDKMPLEKPGLLQSFETKKFQDSSEQTVWKPPFFLGLSISEAAWFASGYLPGCRSLESWEIHQARGFVERAESVAVGEGEGVRMRFSLLLQQRLLDWSGVFVLFLYAPPPNGHPVFPHPRTSQIRTWNLLMCPHPRHFQRLGFFSPQPFCYDRQTYIYNLRKGGEKKLIPTLHHLCSVFFLRHQSQQNTCVGRKCIHGVTPCLIRGEDYAVDRITQCSRLHSWMQTATGRRSTDSCTFQMKDLWWYFTVHLWNFALQSVKSLRSGGQGVLKLKCFD